MQFDFMFRLLLTYIHTYTRIFIQSSASYTFLTVISFLDIVCRSNFNRNDVSETTLPLSSGKNLLRWAKSIANICISIQFSRTFRPYLFLSLFLLCFSSPISLTLQIPLRTSIFSEGPRYMRMHTIRVYYFFIIIINLY